MNIIRDRNKSGNSQYLKNVNNVSNTILTERDAVTERTFATLVKKT